MSSLVQKAHCDTSMIVFHPALVFSLVTCLAIKCPIPKNLANFELEFAVWNIVKHSTSTSSSGKAMNLASVADSTPSQMPTNKGIDELPAQPVMSGLVLLLPQFRQLVLVGRRNETWHSCAATATTFGLVFENH